MKKTLSRNLTVKEDKPDTQIMLKSKCISLSFRNQYSGLFLAGLHKESNLARQLPSGSKEAPNAVPKCLFYPTRELHSLFGEETVNLAKLSEDV